MDELISRQAAIEAMGKATWAKERLAELLPAEPQIIRCNDCKHWIPYDWMFREVWQSKNIADYPEDEIACDCSEMAMKANDFCSRAERREDARLNQQTGGN